MNITTKTESPTVTLTWHASKYKVHKLQQRYILQKGCLLIVYIPYISGTLGNTNVQRHNTEPSFYSRPDIILWSQNWPSMFQIVHRRD